MLEFEWYSEKERLIAEKHGLDNDTGLSPEQQDWHPVGGISWEERAQFMDAKLRESGKILLTSSGSHGHCPGTMELSFETARWFAVFLEGTISTDTHRADEKIYEAKKDFFGNVTFTEIREGGFVSDLVFSSGEIPDILTELQGKMGKEPERTLAEAVSK
ncbi:MAG: hypothetical protein FWB99_01620 [Treponema sp.]|nr:hypothetical protein [Treponema sp.]